MQDYRQTSLQDQSARLIRELCVTHHVHHLRVYGLRDDIAIVCDELDHLAERRSLHLLPFQITERIGQKIKENAALT